MKYIDIKQFTVIITFVLLGFITIISARYVDRYLTEGPELLTDQAFKQSGKFWQIKKKKNDLVKMHGGIVTLSTNSFKSSPGAWQRIDIVEPGSKVEIRGVIKIESVIPGNKQWEQARFLFFQYDRNNKLLKTVNIIASVSGEKDWEDYKRVVQIEKKTVYAKVGIELRKCKGTARFKDLSLQKVKKNPVYKFFQFPVLILWGLFLFYVFKKMFNDRAHFAVNAVLIITMILIVAGTTIPGKLRLNITDAVDNSIIDISTKHFKVIKEKRGEFGRRIHGNTGKIAHYCFFAFFGFLLFFIKSDNSFLMKLQILIVFAGATEMMQFFVDERGPGLFDFLIDLTGGLTGIGLSKLLFKGKNVGAGSKPALEDNSL